MFLKNRKNYKDFKHKEVFVGERSGAYFCCRKKLVTTTNIRFQDDATNTYHHAYTTQTP